MGAGYEEGRAEIELDLEENLNDALTTYLNSIDQEKQDWYGVITGDVVRASDVVNVDYAFGAVDELEAKWTDETYTQGLG